MSEPDVSELISVSRAIEILDNVPIAPVIAKHPLAMIGGRLAEDIRADRDYPPFDKALMDGFAVRRSDLTSIPITFPVGGENAAGSSAMPSLPLGQAVAVMTGAPIPAGADAVIPIEDIDGGWARADQSRITIRRAAAASGNLARQGSECRAGDIVLHSGTSLTSAACAVAASVGAHHIHVFAPPRIALLCTGDEIVPMDETPGASQIRNSNSIMLRKLLEGMGASVFDGGIARDTPEAIRAEASDLTELIRGLDILIVTGGMSMGRHDHVPGVLRDMGFDLKITKLRIKPGKPFIFGEKMGRGSFSSTSASSENGSRPLFVFGLPGNPVSAFVCTVRLASRLIARLIGAPPPEPCLAATLATALPSNGPREFYQPVELRNGIATVLPWRGSADIFTLTRANAFLIREENAPALGAGSPVMLLPIPGSIF